MYELLVKLGPVGYLDEQIGQLRARKKFIQGYAEISRFFWSILFQAFDVLFTVLYVDTFEVIHIF